MFVDATFYCVPAPFYQVLIVMVFDSALGIYIPVAYILMTGKTEECYWQAFNWLTSEVQDCRPYCVGVDFEINFFRSVGTHFPDGKLIGCLFHFKQAGRKKMVELGIHKDAVKYAMRSGVYDLLTVLPKDDLMKGIAYVRTMIADWIGDQDASFPDAKNYKLWDEFFDEYFSKWVACFHSPPPLFIH